MRVPPEVISLILARRLGHASPNGPDVGGVKGRQSPSARPQKLARRNIAKHALLGLVGLMTQNPACASASRKARRRGVWPAPLVGR